VRPAAKKIITSQQKKMIGFPFFALSASAIAGAACVVLICMLCAPTESTRPATVVFALDGLYAFLSLSVIVCGVESVLRAAMNAITTCSVRRLHAMVQAVAIQKLCDRCAKCPLCGGTSSVVSPVGPVRMSFFFFLSAV
jgi:hypothetical protein